MNSTIRVKVGLDEAFIIVGVAYFNDVVFQRLLNFAEELLMDHFVNQITESLGFLVFFVCILIVILSEKKGDVIS